MNPADTYNLCRQYHGKRVRITETCGRVHYGEITRVDRRQVWILPDRRFGGYGLGYWGWGLEEQALALESHLERLPGLH